MGIAEVGSALKSDVEFPTEKFEGYEFTENFSRDHQTDRSNVTA